jgi:acyl-CoA dehydrogenase
MDLVGRKLMDGGEAAFRLIDEIAGGAEARGRPARSGGRGLAGGRALREATEALLALPAERPFRRGRALSAGLCAGAGRACPPEGALADPGREALARVMIRPLLPEHAALLAQAREGGRGPVCVSARGLAG